MRCGEYPNSESHEVGDPDKKEREKFQVGSQPEVSKPHALAAKDPEAQRKLAYFGVYWFYTSLPE